MVFGFSRFGNALKKHTKASIENSIATNSHCPIFGDSNPVVVFDIDERFSEYTKNAAISINNAIL